MTGQLTGLMSVGITVEISSDGFEFTLSNYQPDKYLSKLHCNSILNKFVLTFTAFKVDS